jgi:hypothetical protein
MRKAQFEAVQWLRTQNTRVRLGFSSAQALQRLVFSIFSAQFEAVEWLRTQNILVRTVFSRAQSLQSLVSLVFSCVQTLQSSLSSDFERQVLKVCTWAVFSKVAFSDLSTGVMFSKAQPGRFLGFVDRCNVFESSAGSLSRICRQV